MTDSICLLILDMQDAFLNPIPDAGELVKRVRFAAESAKCFDIDIIATEQVPDKLGRTTPDLMHALEGATFFPKTTFSALGDETIATHLQEKAYEHILLAGIETPICIYQTALHILDGTTDLTLLSDAISGRRPQDRGPILDTLIRAGAHVLPSESVFYSLLGDASHPAFKALTKLVKQAQE